MAERSARSSLRLHAIIGLGLVVGLFGGLGAWAATTEIAGAVIAPGTLVVDGGSKSVQHQEGGIVREIFARDGDLVEAGDLLVRLDGTAVAANRAIVVSQLDEALALKARLAVESGAAEAIAWPADRVESLSGGGDELLAAQERLRRSRADAQQALASRLAEQIGQIEEQVAGLEAQKHAIAAELALVHAEQERVVSLQQQSLIESARVNAVQRDAARLSGELGRLTAEIAAARASVAERRIQIAQVESEFLTEVLAELQQTNLRIAELLQQRIAADDRLGRLEIRAPQSGVVHQSIVRTVGGVVAPGETLMLVVPQHSDLVVEARVAPIDVDKLHVGQAAVTRLSGLDARTTPELNAVVVAVSPDLSHDPATGVPYFVIKVGLPRSELARLPPDVRLVPGMPAEAFVETADRTVLAYLIDPLARQVSHAFRED